MSYIDIGFIIDITIIWFNHNECNLFRRKLLQEVGRKRVHPRNVISYLRFNNILAIIIRSKMAFNELLTWTKNYKIMLFCTIFIYYVHRKLVMTSSDPEQSKFCSSHSWQ